MIFKFLKIILGSAIIFSLFSCKKESLKPVYPASLNAVTSGNISYVNFGAGQTVTYPGTLLYDLNGDGTNDVMLTVIHHDQYYCSDLFHDVLVELVPLTNSVAFAVGYTSNAGHLMGIQLHSMISTGLSWGNYPAMYPNELLLNGLQDGEPACPRDGLLPANGTGYIGVRITSGVNVNYGWIHVRSTADSATMVEFALNNTPNQMIWAGQMQ